MSKATPGPWMIKEGILKGTEIPTFGVGPEGESWVASIKFNGGIMEGVSNARLIAAAPDLLEAAKAALTVLRGSGVTDTTPMMSQLIKAIEKAEHE